MGIGVALPLRSAQRIKAGVTMRIRLCDKASRLLILGVMLFAFAVRALIPQGFMPSSDRPFSVEICPEGFPAQLLAHAGHHHHGGGHSYSEHCVFGAVCPNGSPSYPTALAVVFPAELARPPSCAATPVVVRLVYVPHSRGPPATV